MGLKHFVLQNVRPNIAKRCFREIVVVPKHYSDTG